MTPEELDAIEARASRVYPEDSGWNGTEAEDALPVVTEDVPALVAEVRRLRALVQHLAPEATPLTVDERSGLDALLTRPAGPGAPCADSPIGDPTRLELVEVEAAARAAGDGPRAQVATLGLRAFRCYDRERDRVRELCAILEAARESLGCETWSGVPAAVERLRAWGSVSETLARSQSEMLERNIARAEGFVRERDAALAEAERLRAMVDRARELVAASRHTDDCAASHHQHCGAECDYDDSTPEECARAFREGCECGLRGLCDALGVEVDRG